MNRAVVREKRPNLDRWDLLKIAFVAVAAAFFLASAH